MKKFVTKIVALLLVAVLFAAPSVASAASTPELIYEDAYSKIYHYMPDPLELSTSTNLRDVAGSNANKLWSVPAGKRMTFHIESSGGTYDILVYKEGGSLVHRDTVSGNSLVWLPATSTDATYGVLISAHDSITVYSYGADLLD